MELTAAGLLARLREHAVPGEVAHKHYPGWGDVLCVPMRATFDSAKASTARRFGAVEGVLDDASYEGRLAGFCVLYFKARAKTTTDYDRRTAYELYLRRH